MPADHLTAILPHQAVAGVLAVLSGATLDAVAARNGMDPQDLTEALQVYQAAGLAALERRADATWYQLRVQFPDWDTAERIGAEQLGPRLDQLHANGGMDGWWFLRKHPCWRLRLRSADTSAVDRVLDDLTAAGTLTRWWPTVYEPEVAAFGGPAGIHAAHELFCADSRGILDYARQPAPGLGRRELSILLVSALLRAAGLDWFEHGDVFDRVAQLRPTPSADDATRINALADSVRILLTMPVDSSLFAPGGPVAYAVPWLTAFEAAGRKLGTAAADGTLDRGVRAILTHILIFHWNRFNLSAATQGILAHAATTASLPRN